MRVWLVSMVLLAVAACADRTEVEFVSGPVVGTQLRDVLVATTRAPDPEQAVPGWDRTAEVTFGRFTVSIPGDRELGEIPRPLSRRDADPARHFMLAEAQPLTAGDFTNGLRTRLLDHAPNDREAVIFVHGFNTNFIEGVYRAAQLGHDLNLPGVLLHYSWPSLGAPLAYAHDRESALFARDGLVSMIHQVQAAGPRRIILIAHSMGAHLAMETLRQLALSNDPALASIGGVILISPDVDVELFRVQVQAIGTLPQPFIIVTSQRDRILSLSARLSGERTRLGNLSDAEQVAGLGVTLVDVSAFGSGDGHFTVGSSPALLQLLAQMNAVDLSLSGETSGQLSLIPATILTLQNTTQVVLQPITENRRR
ncbi:MAG: alpha/beta fold hydrolase [Paracoccaceae bacterium]